MSLCFYSFLVLLLVTACRSYELGSIKFPEEFPPSIEACSCSFSEYHYQYESGEFIWVDNADSTGFCKLSDSIYSFQLLNAKENYSYWGNEHFRAEMHYHFRELRDFVHYVRGEMTISTLDGKEIYVGQIVGECGC